MGHERFDGRPKPSLAGYAFINFDAGQTAIVEGNTITGATSGATGIVIQNATVQSGTYGSGDAVGFIAVYNLTGTFANDENLQVSAATVAVANGASSVGTADTAALNTSLRLAAISKRRAVITAMPGSGPARGIATYKGDTFGFRDNAAADACIMHKATTAGWVAQDLGHFIDFDAGTAAFTQGEEITGGTSAATATVERIVIVSGTFAANNAAGYLVISDITGTFQDNETITGGTSSGSAAANGLQQAITLPAGGKYRNKVHNFYGASNLVRLYLTNGQGRAFEWDGSVAVPIRTGLSDALDKPLFVAVHSNHLLLGFRGGAVLYSGTGLPLSFNAVDGAGEINLGTDLTGLQSSTRTSTVISGRNKIAFLTGTDDSNFELKDIAEDSGAIEDTMQVIGEPHFLDDLGVRSLRTADTFGNWQIGTSTSLIEPYILGRTEAGVVPIGALRVRGRSQYRLFYEDGEGVSIYFGRQTPECMFFRLGFKPFCLHSGENEKGNEILFAGDDAGMIYQIDSGTSADGSAIAAYMRLTFLHQGTPTQIKRYHSAFIDVDSGGFGTLISYVANFGYGKVESPSGSEQSTDLAGGGGFWDVAVWDTFVWDASIQGQAIADLDGIGENVSLAIMSDAINEVPHTIASITINYTLRRVLR